MITYINQTIMYTLALFLLLGAADRIAKQFEGSRALLRKLRLSRLADAIDGAGEQFQEGFNAMGPLALAMVGVMAMTPLISAVLSPVVIPIYRFLGASPAMFATTFLAIDMGGYGLAKELATTGGQLDWPAFLYAGLILGSMMGATIVFTIPVGLGLIGSNDRRPFALGILSGMVTIPLGCFAGGVVAMFSAVQGDGQPVMFSLAMLVWNLVPVALVSLLVAIGLWKFRETMVALFTLFAKLLVALVTVALAAVAWNALTGTTLIPGLEPVFPVPGDKPGVDIRAMELLARITLALVGAYPAVFLISRWFRSPLSAAGKLMGINETAATGLVTSLANNLPMFKMLASMDERGKVINVAFSVSAAFIFADHLAFAAANKPDMILAVIAGKLVGGISAVLVAMLLTRTAKAI